MKLAAMHLAPMANRHAVLSSEAIDQGRITRFGKSMRTAALLFLSVVLAGGCASGFMHREAKIVAVKIGLREDEVVALAKEASVRHKRSIAWIRMAGKPDGAFEVGLSDQPRSPHGVVIVFRMIDGRWQEDPSLERTWIV
jgi:hypothetical protein